jgi:hypothetical protein
MLHYAPGSKARGEVKVELHASLNLSITWGQITTLSVACSHLSKQHALLAEQEAGWTS